MIDLPDFPVESPPRELRERILAAARREPPPGRATAARPAARLAAALLVFGTGATVLLLPASGAESDRSGRFVRRAGAWTQRVCGALIERRHR